MKIYSAEDLINGSLRLLGVLAEGEVPTAQMSQDALGAFNQMLDSWSAERLNVFNTQDQVFLWTAGELERTIGPTGDFVGKRPIALDNSTYFRDPASNVSYGIQFINQLQYSNIAVKTSTSSYPQVCWVNMEYPNARLTVYPRPTKELEWHIVSVDELTQPATLATAITFPQGYLRAFRYNLACELAAEFGMEALPTVQKIATHSLRIIKRQNNPNDLLQVPYNLVSRNQKYNIYSGNF